LGAPFLVFLQACSCRPLCRRGQADVVRVIRLKDICADL
jgi:hypothetical protein